jgi:hypothetical protein
MLLAHTYDHVQNMKHELTVLQQLKKLFSTSWPESASEVYRLSDRRLSAMLVPNFSDRYSHVVSLTDPYGRILVFLERSCYSFFQVASSSIVLTRLSEPRSRPTTSQKIW